MQIRCPNCHDSVSISDDSSLQAIACPVCNSSFDLVVDDTVSLAAGGKEGSSNTRKRLAQFDLLEHLGMGAFGSVWKAKDTKLDRIVAIKIPRKEQLSEQDAEQFFREARAAAQIKHPNIVGIHEVGRDDGTIFIVSEYVQGLPLSDWLAGQHPSIRTAIQLAIRIADALHAAHEHGIVHRDLKPSNIMLDESGEPHVMDFGLAKRDAGEVTMTLDGQVLGTPAYMSPEQAKGDAHIADRRADVYALGVILFELLTGEKPFRGNMRMLLHQVLNEEAPSPRKLNSNVPRDVETITLRCLEKDPGRRFQSASDLSADLGRFLNNEPVHSRPISRVEKGVRWCKRYPVAAVLSGLISFLLVIVSGLWLQAQSIAASEKGARIEIELEKVRADENLIHAQNVVNDFFTEVAESPDLLRGTPGTQQLRLRLLEKAMTYYETFLATNDSVENAEVAAVHHRLARMQEIVHLLDEAEKSYTQSVSLFEVLLAQDNNDPLLRNQLASSTAGLGSVYYKMNEFEKSIEHHNLAKNILRQLELEDGDNTDYKLRLSAIHTNIGLAFNDMGELDAAAEHYETAIDIGQQLVNDHPEVLEYQFDLAGSLMNLGALDFQRRKDLSELVRQNETALDILRMLVDKDSKNQDYLSALAGCYANHAGIYDAMWKPDEAIANCENAISYRRQLVDQNPDVPRYLDELAMSYGHAGNCYLKILEYDEAKNQFKEAITIATELVNENTSVPDFQNHLATHHHDLGLVHSKMSDFDKAVEQYDIAIEIWKQQIAEGTVDTDNRVLFAGCCVNKSNIYAYVGKHGEAIELLTSAKLQLEPIVEANSDHFRAMEYLANATLIEAWTLNERARQLSISADENVRDGVQAVADATRACELSGWANHQYLDTLAAAYAETGDFDNAIEFQQKAIDLAPESTKIAYELHLSLYNKQMPLRETDN